MALKVFLKVLLSHCPTALTCSCPNAVRILTILNESELLDNVNLRADDHRILPPSRDGGKALTINQSKMTLRPTVALKLLLQCSS